MRSSIVFLLSVRTGTGSSSINLITVAKFFNQIASFTAELNTQYSAAVLDGAIIDYFLLLYEIGVPA